MNSVNGKRKTGETAGGISQSSKRRRVLFSSPASFRSPRVQPTSLLPLFNTSKLKVGETLEDEFILDQIERREDYTYPSFVEEVGPALLDMIETTNTSMLKSAIVSGVAHQTRTRVIHQLEAEIEENKTILNAARASANKMVQPKEEANRLLKQARGELQAAQEKYDKAHKEAVFYKTEEARFKQKAVQESFTLTTRQLFLHVLDAFDKKCPVLRRFGKTNELAIGDICALVDCHNLTDVKKLDKEGCMQILTVLDNLGFASHPIIEGLWNIPPRGMTPESFREIFGNFPNILTGKPGGAANVLQLRRRVCVYLQIEFNGLESLKAEPTPEEMTDEELKARVEEVKAQAEHLALVIRRREEERTTRGG